MLKEGVSANFRHVKNIYLLSRIFLSACRTLAVYYFQNEVLVSCYDNFRIHQKHESSRFNWTSHKRQAQKYRAKTRSVEAR